MATGDGTQTQTNDEETPLLRGSKREDITHDEIDGGSLTVSGGVEESERVEIAHTEFNGGSFTGGVFNLATTIVGAGLMALPATMKILGIGPGIAMIILMAVLTDLSIEFVLRFSTFGQRRSYAALMEESYGRFGRIWVQVSVLVSTIGVLIVYIIIIGDVMAGILEERCGVYWYSSRNFVILLTTLCVIVLTSFKRLDSLRFSSYLAVFLAAVFLVITVIIVIFKWCNHDLKKPALIPNVTNLSSLLKHFTVMPVLVNAFVCHYNVHSIRNELQNTAQMQPVVRTALWICVCVYVMIGVSGYLLFGEATLDDVLANFDKSLGLVSGVVEVVRVSYAAHLLFVFPVIFHPLRVNLDGLLFPTAQPLTESNRRFIFITAILIAVIICGALFIPNIWDAFQITGATACVCLGFIFPAAVILKDHHNRATKRDKIIAVFMIVLASSSAGIAIYSDIKAMLKNGTTFPI